MTDFDRESATAAADGSRDAAALIRAMLDHDDAGRDAVLFGGDAMLTAVSLSAFAIFAIPDRARLQSLITAWRNAAASTEGGTPE